MQRLQYQKSIAKQSRERRLNNTEHVRRVDRLRYRRNSNAATTRTISHLPETAFKRAHIRTRKIKSAVYMESTKEIRADKNRKRYKRWRLANLDRELERGRTNGRFHSQNITDYYVKNIISLCTKIDPMEITNEMIAAKRAGIIEKRKKLQCSKSHSS